MKNLFLAVILLFILPVSLFSQGEIEGKVTITDNANGADTISLPGANVIWASTTSGTTTNAAGYFTLKKVKNSDRLVISFVGYDTDTITINDDQDYVEIMLREKSLIDEVTVIGRVSGSHINRNAPIMTVNITSGELCKAACCNLSESFVTNASVDVNYSDAATGAKQIQLLGLAGNYVQILTENIPAMYGLGAAYGLSYIPGPWMESIQVSKGTSSVRNGNESITGQINVEYKKPSKSEVFFINGFLSDAGKQELNMNTSVDLNKKWSTILLAHGERQSDQMDHNDDGFRDEPDVTQYNLFNRWDYIGEDMTFRAGIKYMDEDRIGGQFLYSPKDNDTWSNGYGIDIATTRAEAFTKLGGVFGPGEKMSVGWIQSMTYHDMNTWFGYKNYAATQKSYYTNLLYQYFPGEKHTIDAGVSYRYDHYDEQLGSFSTVSSSMIFDPAVETVESVPGVFLQYTYTDSAKITLLAGARYDFYNAYGAVFTPRIHLRYSITPKLTLRASAGKGYRTVHILAENMYYLASSRTMIIDPDLDIEQAWNAGLNLTGYVPIGDRDIRLTGEYYRTSFLNQIVTDLDASVDEVHFYNLDGDSWSDVFQIESQFEPLRRLDMTVAWRWNNVRQTIGGELRDKPLSSRYKGLLNISYATRMKKWQIDYTLQYNGPGRIPSTASNPDPYRRDLSFGAYPVMNTQLTKYFRRWSIYAGAENITNYMQKDPVIDAENPYSEYFDSAMIWGPVHGRKIYAGIRFAIDRE